MLLTAVGKRFLCVVKFSERDIPRDAGFKFGQGQWYTDSPRVAAKLRVHADISAELLFRKHFIHVSPWPSPLPTLRSHDMRQKPYQLHAALFALERNRSYLRMDPGTGKTITAAIIASAYLNEFDDAPAVYICPAGLVANVVSEMETWLAGLYGVGVLEPPYEFISGDVIVVPDSILHNPAVMRSITDLRRGLLIVDEAHRFKSATAKRTAALLKHYTDWALKVVLMTGTPMPNRPIELYPVLSKLAPEAIDFASEWEYGRKFCAGHQKKAGRRMVWDMSGASNMEELAERLFTPKNAPGFMHRVTKDVLNLPPLTEEIFVVADKMPPKLAKLDTALGSAYSTEDVMKGKIAAKRNKEELHLATYRRLLGVEKAKLVIPYIKDVLEETTDAILVFAHHQEVITLLETALAAFEPVVITGATVLPKFRQAYVDKFQQQKRLRLLIANYTALGVGFNVTKANRVMHVEYSWVPGENDQSTARSHRLGQDKSVFVQYFCYANSLDNAILRSLMRKRKSISFI